MKKLNMTFSLPLHLLVSHSGIYCFISIKDAFY